MILPDKLSRILDTMETFQLTYPEDACIYLGDTEKIIGALPGKTFDLKIPVGTLISSIKGSVTEQAFSLGKVLQQERGPEMFGVPYVSTASPIYDKGQKIGVIAAVVSNTKVETLRQGSSELSASVEQMTATTEQVAHTSNDLASRLQELHTESQSMVGDIEKVHSILSFVQEVASQSHLLGLNAAIEAARAGEHGRGFTVVANEIRKMADRSKSSANEIHNQLLHLQSAIERMNSSIQHMAAYTQENSAGMEELHSSFQHIAEIADRLHTIR
jgi:uncharacterized protein YukE